MAVDQSHVLQAFLAAGKISQAEFQAAWDNVAKFNALVARVASQNSGRK